MDNKIKTDFDFQQALKKFFNKDSTKSIIASLISIFIGLLFGLLVMMFVSLLNDEIDFSYSFRGFAALLKGPFNSRFSATRIKEFGNMLFRAVPLIFTGLSVAIAFKTGLFNIGASGQFLMATLGSLYIALSIDTTGNRSLGILVWILAIIVGTLLAALWGMIPGVFKAFFGTNEVIICIMTNWIAANITTWFFSNKKNLINIPEGKSGILFKTTKTGNYSPSLGLDKLTNGSQLDISIIIAILVAIGLHILMNKTTLGYQLKACGANKNAAKYAGMNEKRNIILSMAISGALAGLGACFFYLNPNIEFTFNSAYQNLPAEGFNGISVALLASCSPIGVIFSSMFINYLAKGGQSLLKYKFNQYIADMITAVIIYLAGFSKLFRDIFTSNKIKNIFVKKQGGKA